MTTQPPNSSDSREEIRMLGKMAGLGFQFGSEIIAGLLLGWGFDAFFGTNPWGIAIGAVAGILVGLLHLFRQAIRINREMDRQEAARRSARRTTTPGDKRLFKGDQKQAQQMQLDLLEAQFDEALDHEQWKKAQDKRLDPGSEPQDDHDHNNTQPNDA